EDHEVVVAQVEQQPAQLLLVNLQSHLSIHAHSLRGGRDSSLSRFSGGNQFLLRAGGAKCVGLAAWWAGKALRCRTRPAWTSAAASTSGATTEMCEPRPMSGPTLVLPVGMERNQRRAAASARAPSGFGPTLSAVSASAW